MARENVETVRQAFEALNRRDANAAVGLLAADAKIVPLRAALEDTVYSGPTAFQDFLTAAAETWSKLRVEIETYRESGSRVLAIGRIRGTARSSGAQVVAPAAWIVTFDRHRITEFRTYPNQQEALEAFGVEGGAVSPEKWT